MGIEGGWGRWGVSGGGRGGGSRINFSLFSIRVKEEGAIANRYWKQTPGRPSPAPARTGPRRRQNGSSERENSAPEVGLPTRRRVAGSQSHWVRMENFSAHFIRRGSGASLVLHVSAGRRVVNCEVRITPDADGRRFNDAVFFSSFVFFFNRITFSG